ncbi:MAG: hypothetical protein IPJ32_07220 [Sphingobacteriaceae bacterium]|nr:hypothetical protein [Sphingobacteriaceae bacterium]
MSNLFENREKFKSAIGHFVIKFSELEFSLLYYCGIIDHLRNKELGIREQLQSTFEERRKKISKFIREELPELQETWYSINMQLGEINRDRRFIVHGIGRTNFFSDSVKAFIPQKDRVDIKDYSIDSIKNLSDRIAHLLTGENGLTGEFLVEFNTKRFDLHNRTTLDDNKIIYKVNDKILTKFKG